MDFYKSGNCISFFFMQEKGAGQSCTFFFSTSGEARSLAPDYWMIAARLAA